MKMTGVSCSERLSANSRILSVLSLAQIQSNEAKKKIINILSFRENPRIRPFLHDDQAMYFQMF